MQHYCILYEVIDLEEQKGRFYKDRLARSTSIKYLLSNDRNLPGHGAPRREAKAHSIDLPLSKSAALEGTLRKTTHSRG